MSFKRTFSFNILASIILTTRSESSTVTEPSALQFCPPVNRISVVAVLSLQMRSPSAFQLPNLWAKHNLEVHLAIVANSISRATSRRLVGVSPALIRRTIVRRARLARARALRRVHSHSNADFAALHHGNIVRRAFEAVVRAVAELE
jgi:hypothetical protein